MGRSARYGKTDDLLAPQIEAIGHRSFTAHELDALARWLQQPGWPRGAMNIFALQGYLVALLVMPLGLRTGIWIPTIWNESGWKIPLALQAREKYDEFLELLIGFMRYINVGFQESPPRFELVQAPSDICRNRAAALRTQDWVHGFGQALAHCAHVNAFFDPTVRAALHAIATHATESDHANKTSSKTKISIQHAVLILAQARTSHGPLSGFPIETKKEMIQGRPK